MQLFAILFFQKICILEKNPYNTSHNIFSMNIITAFNNFLVYLRLHKGRSRKTQEQYAFHIWRFISWIEPEIAKILESHLREEQKIPTEKNFTISPEIFLPPENADPNWKSPLIPLSKLIHKPNIEEIKKEDFDEWRLSLADSGLSTKTTNAHIITMRSWLKYLKKEEIDCLDPTTLDLLKTTDREVTFLTPEEIESFFATIPTDHIRGKRDFAICECIYSTGLRISELTALNRDDINLDTLEFAVRGKG